jgi:LPS-assembly protein
MRFRSRLVLFSLLLSLAPPLPAEELAPILKPTRRLLELPESAQPTPIFMYADQVEGVKDKQIEATGHVEMRRLGQRVWADYLLYLQETQELHARGSVRVQQDNNLLQGPEAHFNLEQGSGNMPHPEFFLGENNSHGRADSLHIANRQSYTLKNASYTTCPADKEDWLLKAGSLNIDQGTQIGEAEDVTIRWKGLPLLYTPWLDFPINDQRKSGFLSPVFGATTQGGSELTVPFYWNLAPNMDATLAPRVMVRRGVLLKNELRYLKPGYGGEVNLDVMPNDRVTGLLRSRFALRHQQQLSAGLSGGLNYNHVSDDAYFRDLSDTANTASQINMLREGVLSYHTGGWWDAQLRVQRYQTLQDPAAPVVVPYYRTPQINLNAQQPVDQGTLKFAGEFVDFSHPSAVNGRRLVLYPSFSYPLTTLPGLHVTPKIGWHSTTYSLGVNNNAQLPNNVTRNLPIVSLDGKLDFERETQLFGHDFVQTLEPRAYFVYIPYRDQNALPVFDTAQSHFNFAQIFSENRFVGSDRIGDANQVTAALTSRLIDPENGEERLQLMLGQRFSNTAPQVNLAAQTANSRSDILLGASARPNRIWSVDALAQYNPSMVQNQLLNLSARYQPESGKTLNLGYRFLRSTLNLPGSAINHVNLSAQWPLFGRWNSVFRTNYSLQEKRLVESLFGLEYNQDCWTVRLVAQRYAIATQQASTGFFLQLELNGLLKVGPDPLLALKQGIPGYTKMNQLPTDKPLPNLFD